MLYRQWKAKTDSSLTLMMFMNFFLAMVMTVRQIRLVHCFGAQYLQPLDMSSALVELLLACLLATLLAIQGDMFIWCHLMLK